MEAHSFAEYAEVKLSVTSPVLLLHTQVLATPMPNLMASSRRTRHKARTGGDGAIPKLGMLKLGRVLRDLGEVDWPPFPPVSTS